MQQGPYDPNQPGQRPYQGQQQGPQQWPQQNPPNNDQQPPQQQPQYQQQYQPNQYQQYPQQQYYQPPKKKRNMKLIVAVVAVVAILLIASMAVLFWPDDGGDNGSETIGPQGGVLSITSGALDGLRIEVPSGASEDPVDIDVTSEEVDDLPGLPEVGRIASRLITINTDGSDSWNVFKMFDDALTVTLPYDEDLVDDEEAVRFYVYDPARDHFEPTGFISQDYEENTITFQASTFSQFVAIEVAMTLLEGAGSSLSVDTGFRPAEDGWYIPNYGSYLESGGLCLGMVSYAKWYYTYQKGTGTGLYDKYREGDLNQWRDDATALELATRVQLGVTGIWGAMTAEERSNTTTKQTGLSIIHGMLVSGEPQLVGLQTLYNNGSWGAGGHAILAYKYDNGRFYMYDPNNPGTDPNAVQQQMPFNYTTGFSQIYKSGLNAANPLQFNVFYHAGAKVFSPLNAYKGLYDSAEDGFDDDSVFPNIELTDVTTEITGETPTDTDADGTRDTTETYCKITGTIDGGQQAVQKTLVFVGNKKFQATVANGEFEVQVPLKQGVNDIVVLATDRNTFSNWAGFYRTEIESTAARGALTVTMSWGEDNSDVDLHVLEPYGRHIYYSNRGYDTNGPYLDFDNTYGYGPEHYYATDDNVMYDSSGAQQSTDIFGTYQIGVHYYADHDDNDEEDQPITWTVTISYLVIYIEATGQEIWEEVTYSGYLDSADSGSASSFGSGGGWSEIMTFECFEPDPDDYSIPNPEDVTFPD
jgi:uncharacterized protein YfaP (DUF2135 family)